MKNSKTQARRDKARQKKEADRRLIRLGGERNELWRMKWDAPYEKLEHPYQRGWVRYFVLTKEVLRRKDAKCYRALLKYVQRIQYSPNRDFLVRSHAKSTRYRKRHHKLRTFKVWEALHYKMSNKVLSCLVTQKRHPVGSRDRLRELQLSDYRGSIRVRYLRYFESKIEPYMITHARVALPDVERRLTEVDAILDQPQNWGRLQKLQRSRPYYWKMIKESLERPYLKRELMKEAELVLQGYFMEPEPMTQERALSPLSLLLFRVVTHTFCRHPASAT